MYTQDGAHVSLNEKDDQLVVEHGTWRRTYKGVADVKWISEKDLKLIDEDCDEKDLEEPDNDVEMK